MRHVNIPIFIPHLGCPNQCIFCNQRYISGTVCFDELKVKETIDNIVNQLDNESECEIAFFGGSFTGLNRNLMIRLLDLAQSYVDSNKVVGIRMSTRPDYISREILDILQNYSITYVELGIQSMNDDVLLHLKRGHTVKDTIVATELLNEYKIGFVGQMMIGLPSATAGDEIYCAEQICRLGAKGARIYPTLVFKMTDLEKMTNSGEYIPLSVDEAVERSAAVLNVFVSNGVPCIRIGLCDSDNLHSNDSFVSGPNEPSIGEMVKSRLYLNMIIAELNKFNGAFELVIINCRKGLMSQIVGHKRTNIETIKERFKVKKVIVRENLSQCDVCYKIEVKGENS